MLKGSLDWEAKYSEDNIPTANYMNETLINGHKCMIAVIESYTLLTLTGSSEESASALQSIDIIFL